MEKVDLLLDDLQELVEKRGKSGAAKVTGNNTTNGSIRRIPEPRLEAHRSRGNLYYHYCRGSFREYLGSADSILKAVREAKHGP